MVGCDTEVFGLSLSRMTLQRNMLRQFVCSSLHMAATCLSKTLASLCHTSWCHIPAEPCLSSKRLMDVRSGMCFFFHFCTFFDHSHSTTNKMHLLSQIICSCKTLYMFRTLFSSIIRSIKLRIQQRYMSNSCCYLLLSGMRWNGTYTQFYAPDDGRKDRNM
jgi:hypothetical protein